MTTLPEWQKWNRRERKKEYLKTYRKKPEVKERMKVYFKAYGQTPKRKAYDEARRKTPEWKEYQTAYRTEYYQQPEKKIHMNIYFKIYHQRSEVKEHHRKYQSQRRRTNIQFKLRNRLGDNFLQSLKRYGEGKKMSSKKYGVDWTPAIEKLVATKPADFGERKYHIDHIKPVSSFDLTNHEQIRQAYAPENLQWLTAEENLRKGNKVIR